MSEKRFRLDYEEDDAIFIVEDDDIVYPIRNDTIKQYQLQKIVDKLNEQQSTIQFLQDEIDELKKDIDIYEYEEKKHSKFARKLYDENEQLRKELKEIKENPINYF